MTEIRFYVKDLKVTVAGEWEPDKVIKADGDFSLGKYDVRIPALVMEAFIKMFGEKLQALINKLAK